MKLPTYQMLSKEQDRIYNLPLNRSCLVTGPPGTGKTVMALYRAHVMQKSNRSSRLLMYGRLLSQYVNKAVETLGISSAATTFDSYITSTWRSNYGGNIPQVAAYQYDWNQVLGRMAAGPPAGDKPHLIVDEAQDLPKEFFIATTLLTDGVTIFADENQRIKETNSTLDDIRNYANLNGDELVLRRNYRNTRQIHDVAAHFYTGLQTGVADPPAEVGDRPILRSFATESEEVEWISRWVKNHDDLTVGVLVPYASQRTSLFNKLRHRLSKTGQVQQYQGGKGKKAPPLNWERPGVKVLAYASAKGLEFDAVFMPYLQAVTADLKVPDIRMQFYVLATRARTHLFYSYNGSGTPLIVDLLPLHLMDVQ